MIDETNRGLRNGKRVRPTLADKVAFLKRPASFPDRPKRVESVETHMSWVFLTKHHAYKLKKPVCFDFLDYRTLAARRHCCEEEVRLNQRLAAGIYLAVVPLVTESGMLQLAGTGEVVDWLVKMRRLPMEVRLDVGIRRGGVDSVRLRSALQQMAAFYAESRPVPIIPAQYRARLEADIRADYQVLAMPRHRLPMLATNRLIAAQLAFVTRQAALIERRATRVVEAHGDLRPEHIYLRDTPVFVDRLEFNRELRLLDPAEELAYLAMECERLGARWIGDLAFDVYRRSTSDHAPPSLIAFYRSRRACLRAKLAVGHLQDPSAPVPSPWLDRAAAYLALARRYADAFRGAA